MRSLKHGDASAYCSLTTKHNLREDLRDKSLPWWCGLTETRAPYTPSAEHREDRASEKERQIERVRECSVMLAPLLSVQL